MPCKTKECWLFSRPAFTLISVQQPYITTAAVLDVVQLGVMLSAQNKVEAFARTGTYPFSFKGAEVAYNCFISRMVGLGTVLILILLTFKWVYLKLSKKSFIQFYSPPPSFAFWLISVKSSKMQYICYRKAEEILQSHPKSAQIFPTVLKLTVCGGTPDYAVWI